MSGQAPCCQLERPAGCPGKGTQHLAGRPLWRSRRIPLYLVFLLVVTTLQLRADGLPWQRWCLSSSHAGSIIYQSSRKAEPL